MSKFLWNILKISGGANAPLVARLCGIQQAGAPETAAKSVTLCFTFG